MQKELKKAQDLRNKSPKFISGNEAWLCNELVSGCKCILVVAQIAAMDITDGLQLYYITLV